MALFTKLGVEPIGRILTGVFELVACVLLLIPGRVVYGALLSLGLMAGALMSHIAVLGFEGSNGTLGILALLVLIASGAILFLERESLSQLKQRFS